jgi:hypothetical protein
MPQILSRERLKELYLPPQSDFVLVDVPEMQFVMIDGEGRADGESFAQATKWLFSVIHPLKRIVKEHMGKDYVEPPLEGLWWADDVEDLVAGNKDKLKWRLMIVTSDWFDQESFEQAVTQASQKLGSFPSSLRLEHYDEGKSAQIMYVGPPSKVASTVARLYHEFLPQNDLVPNGYHHQIYLNDPNRVAPEKLRTVLRQPVRSSQ